MRSAQQLLGGGDRVRPPEQDVVTQLGDRGLHVVGDVGDEAHVEGAGGIEHFAGQVGGRNLRPAAALHDRAGDDRRGHADAHLGEGERDRRVDDGEITCGHQPDAAGAHGAVDGSDHWRGRRAQPFDRSDERRRVDPPRRTLLQVCAGTEHRRGVGEDDHSGAFGLRGIQRIVKVGEQLLRQSVAIGGGVECDRGNATDH